MSGSVGQVNKRYISAIQFLDRRDILPGIISVNNDYDLLDILELTGRSKKAIMPQYINYVADALFLNGDTTGESVTGSGTTTVTATLTTATSGYARVNDSVRFPDGKVGRITAISTASTKDQLTIKSVDANNLTLVPGGTLVFFSNAQGEGSLSPAARRWGQTPYTDQIQIFKDKAQITDIQMASQVETEWNGTKYYTYKAFNDSYMSFRAQISLALLMERLSVTKFSDASPAASGVDTEGNPIQHTRGLDQAVSDSGFAYNLASAGTVTYADFQGMVASAVAHKAPMKYWVWGSSIAKMAYDTFLKNLDSTNRQPSLYYMADGKKIDFGMEGFTIGGIQFDWKVLPVFNHPVVQATDIAKNAYFIPQDNVKTTNNGSQERISIRTMNPPLSANDKGNGVYSEVHLGKYADQPTGERSVLEAHWEAHIGTQFLGVEHFFKQRVLGN